MIKNTEKFTRQAHFIASMIIFASFILGHFVNPQFQYLALLVGFGTFVSAVSGFCPMSFFLKKLQKGKRHE